MRIYCCGCLNEIEARLTDGEAIYPHRADLAWMPFWICDDCGNYVGTHHKQPANPTRPLGCIPTPEIREWRQKIHAALDGCLLPRREQYERLSAAIGYEYHTAEIRSVEEAERVLEIITAWR